MICFLQHAGRSTNVKSFISSPCGTKRLPFTNSFKGVVRSFGTHEKQKKEALPTSFVRRLWDSFTRELCRTWNGQEALLDASTTGNQFLEQQKDRSVSLAEMENAVVPAVSRGSDMNSATVDNAGNGDASGRMQKRFNYSPIIQEIRESHYWQPTVSRDLENHGLDVLRLRRYDPNFSTLDNWRRDIVGHTLLLFMKAVLEGRAAELLPTAVGNDVLRQELAAEMRERHLEGIQIDSQVIDILTLDRDIWAIVLDKNDQEQRSPIIILHFICRQVKCVRQSSVIIEGSPNDICDYSYVVALQLETSNKVTSRLKWKVIDFQFNGSIDRYVKSRTNVRDEPDYFEIDAVMRS